VNFALDETQQALAELAAQVAAGSGGHDRAQQVEAEGGFDPAAWAALGTTGLLSAVAEGDGGVLGAAEIVAALAREVVSVPAYALLAALGVLGPDAGDAVLAGTEVVTIALAEPGLAWAEQARTRVAGDGTISGRKIVVPGLAYASSALVAAQGPHGPGLYRVDLDQPGVQRIPIRTTDRLDAGQLDLSGAAATPVGDAAALRRAEQVAAVLSCAALIGLGKQATRGAAAYVTERQQFGRTIASFQSPVLKLADAHMDTEAMLVTMQQAAWQLDAGQDAAAAVDVAKWWAAGGGHRTIHTAQHLHGGIGADISFPAHRYFIRGKQLVDTLGGAAVHASHLGAALAGRA
jgi:3-oxocholest-4-en-26-oyl-CoA dehydrogenase beta subunit